MSSSPPIDLSGTDADGSAPFRWDRLTVAAVAGYCMQICAMSVGNVFGELREQFGISGVVTALHGSTFGIGLLVMGSVGVALVDRIGRRATVAASWALIAVGVAVFCIGPTWKVTLLGTVVSGLGGAMWVMVIPGIIADHHGPNRAHAFAAVNGVPIVAGMAFSVVVGAALAAGGGWRVPYAALTAVIAVGSVAVARRVEMPGAARHSQFTLRHFLDRSVLVPWAKIVNVVLAEFTIAIWAVTYLREVGGASSGAAPILAMVFGFMVFVIRMFTKQLQRIFGQWIMIVSFVVMGTSVISLTLVGPLWAKVVVLTVAGLGAGPLYPLIVDRFYDAAGHRLDTVGLGAYCALASGVGVLFGPLLVGVVADTVELRWAVLAVPALVLVAIATQWPTAP